MLGFALAVSPNPQHDKELGFRLLEDSFDPAKVSPTIDFNFPQTYLIAATIGRYRNQMKEYGPALKYTQLALKLSEQHATSQSEITCIRMQLSNMLAYFPETMEDADKSYQLSLSYGNELLNDTTSEGLFPIDDKELLKFPGAAGDPWNHCMISIFPLSFYHEDNVDVAKFASNAYQMALKAWPEMGYTADFVKRYDEETKGKGHAELPRIDRKIRLAMISGVLTEGHSNSESFRGVFSRLDRNIFDVTYVLVAEQGITQPATFTRKHPSDTVMVLTREDRDQANSTWVLRFAKEIEKLELDIIFYTDMTMSSWCRRLGMMRLAPVQAQSHGHPMTSGHDRSVIQYFISWAASELPLEVSQTHYTEELKLVDAGIMFQYYERRILPNQVSRLDGQSFAALKRSDFGLPADKPIYLCMQKVSVCRLRCMYITLSWTWILSTFSLITTGSHSSSTQALMISFAESCKRTKRVLSLCINQIRVKLLNSFLKSA